MSVLSNFVLSSFKMFQDKKDTLWMNLFEKRFTNIAVNLQSLLHALQQEGILIDCQPPAC